MGSVVSHPNEVCVGVGGSLNENHDTSDVEKERRRWSGKTRMGGEAAATQFIPSPASPDQHTHTLALLVVELIIRTTKGRTDTRGSAADFSQDRCHSLPPPRVRYQLNKLFY